MVMEPTWRLWWWAFVLDAADGQNGQTTVMGRSSWRGLANAGIACANLEYLNYQAMSPLGGLARAGIASFSVSIFPYAIMDGRKRLYR